MANTLVINVVDRSVAPLNHVNIAVINQPNPVEGYTATADEVAKLIQIPNYFITDENGEQVSGLNYYKYFPKSGGGGGGSTILIEKTITENGEYSASADHADGYSSVDVSVPPSGTTILNGSSEPSAATGSDGDLYVQTTDKYVESITNNTFGCGVQINYYMNENSIIEFDCSLPAPKRSYDTPFGSRGNTDYFIAYNDGMLRYDFSGALGNIGDISSYYNKRIKITLSKTIAKVEYDGSVIYNKTVSGGSTLSSTKLGFFALFTNNSGSYMSSTESKGTIYGCKIYEGETLVRDYIPYKDSDGAYCIKETLSDTLYYPIDGIFTGSEVSGGDEIINYPYLKVNSDWQPLIGSKLSDINAN